VSTRGYSSADFPGFGRGLDLKTEPDHVKPDAALDCLNVEFTKDGGIQRRSGYDNLSTAQFTNRPDSIARYYKTDGTTQLVVGNSTRLDAIDAGGVITGGTLSSTASPHFFARFGGPTSELLFIANGTDTIKQWNGTAFSTPAYTDQTPTGKFVAVTGWDNRLVSACHVGTSAASNPSSVIFSDPGNPLNFASDSPDNNYEQLTPGDGESIMGMIAWREYLFVFKETSFFVFYGTSVGQDGYPVFNYRQIRAGVGLASSRAVCAGRDGVYFLDRSGVYRTTGGEPEEVSNPVEPIFVSGTSDFYTGGTLSQPQVTNAAMTWYQEQVYLAFTTSGTTNNRMLVYDTHDGTWTLWDVAASCLDSFRVSSQPDLVFGYATGLKHIGRLNASFVSDDGTAITTKWQGGWHDYGSSDVKTIRESKLWGKGNFNFGYSKDFSTVVPALTALTLDSATDTWGDGSSSADLWGDGTNPNDTWGPSSVITPKLVRVAKRGTVFSLYLSGSSSTSTWRLHRLTSHFRESRNPTTLKVAN
jgi:hypothetical protein